MAGAKHRNLMNGPAFFVGEKINQFLTRTRTRFFHSLRTQRIELKGCPYKTFPEISRRFFSGNLNPHQIPFGQFGVSLAPKAKFLGAVLMGLIGKEVYKRLLGVGPWCVCSFSDLAGGETEEFNLTGRHPVKKLYTPLKVGPYKVAKNKDISVKI